MWKTILNIRHKAILAIAVLAACGIVTFVLSRKKLEQEEAKRERKEIGDLRNAEWEWSKSVLSPKSGNPKVFFDKFSFEHGLMVCNTIPESELEPFPQGFGTIPIPPFRNVGFLSL
jgi:hypothetical protein